MRTEGAGHASKRIVEQGGARLAQRNYISTREGVDARTLDRATKRVLALARCGLCGWTECLGFKDLSNLLAREV
jgi:hypothetical protein